MVYQYTLRYQGIGYGVAPDDPTFGCDGCGRDTRECVCPGGDGWHAATLADFARRCDDGEFDYLMTAGFEAVLNGESR